MAYIYKTRKPKPSPSPFMIKLLWLKIKREGEALDSLLEIQNKWLDAEKEYFAWNRRSLAGDIYARSYDITQHIKELGYKIT